MKAREADWVVLCLGDVWINPGASWLLVGCLGGHGPLAGLGLAVLVGPGQRTEGDDHP